jgi:DNA-binding LacI/PurR family transcriptional regulator
MATMRQVAERANVSIATVSFVVNDTKPVSPETRDRILTAMAELGYRRNVVARALASRRTRIIALLVPALDRRLGTTAMDIVKGAATAAHKRGYDVVLWPVGTDVEHMSELIAGGLVDGVLLMEVRVDDPRVERLTASKATFAMIGRTRNPDGLPFVDMDFERTVENALDYLTGLGHTRIALMTEQLEGTALSGYGPVVRTTTSFHLGMSKRGLVPVSLTCERTPRGGRAAAAELLQAAPETTAIMVMNDTAAFGVVSGLTHAGRQIPDDVSILSIATSAEMAAMSDPVLSTMNAPGEELGRLGADALIDQLEGRAATLPQVLLPCPLEVAESTGPPPAGSPRASAAGPASQADAALSGRNR